MILITPNHMKIKLLVCAVILAANRADATTFQLTNYESAPFVDTTGTPLNGSVVCMGYFSGGPMPSDNLSHIATMISNFSIIKSGLTIDGYVEDDNPDAFNNIYTLAGRTIYVFAGNTGSLSSSTAWGLMSVGTATGDSPPTLEPPITADVDSESSVIIGKVYYDFDSGRYGLQLVPEPSALLLVAISSTVLMRRRRI
jgi:hypothetical protein